MASAGIIPLLIDCLSSPSQSLIEASARTLRALFHDNVVFQIYEPNLDDVSVMIALIDYDCIVSSQTQLVGLRIAETVISVVSKALSSLNYLANMGAYQRAAYLLVKYTEPMFDYNPKLQESALDAISSLCKDNPSLSGYVSALTSMKSKILNLFRFFWKRNRSFHETSSK